MKTVKLPAEVLESLEQVEGRNFTEKIKNLLKQRMLAQLRECGEQILEYEAKYGMSFEQFETAWKGDEIEDKHSHKVERDLMEWEGFVLERQRWLSMLRGLKS
jgi:hypothetical protein